MDRLGQRALQQVELAEAELALLIEEQVLRDLLTPDEPSAECRERLQRLREVAANLAGK